MVGRLPGPHFQLSLEKTETLGHRQFAYTGGRGHGDALALVVCTWLLELARGNRVGLCCSDFLGASDRVSLTCLLNILWRNRSMPRALAPLLWNWLRSRLSTVIVDGVHSSARLLADSVYQGTV